MNTLHHPHAFRPTHAALSVVALLVFAGCSSAAPSRANATTPTPPTGGVGGHASDTPAPVPVAPTGFTGAGGLSPLAGLTEPELGLTGAPVDAAENLFQATFGREGADFDPDISRDGKWLTFASTQHRATSDLYIKSVTGQTVTQLTNDPANDVMPSFSPDGQRIAFASNRSGSWDIYVMGAKGGQAIQLTSEPSHELHPSWSPDGKNLAFCRLNPGSGRWEVWTIDVANPGVSSFLAHGLLPQWNPVTDHIAFQKPRERGERYYSVWTIQYDGAEAHNPTEIAGDPEFACVSPTWSPDGERLAFATVMNPGGPIVGGLGFKPTESQLWMVNLDGTGKVRLTEEGFVNVMPCWGGDGRLYFVSNRAGVENIWGLTPNRAIQTASFSTSPGMSPEPASATAHGAHAPAPSPAHAPAPAHAATAPFQVVPTGPSSVVSHPPATAHAGSAPTPMTTPVNPASPAGAEPKPAESAAAPTHDESSDHHD